MSASTAGAEGPLSVNVSGRQRRQVLALVLTLGLVITFWRLGSTGVVDETPPLFAAAGRAMADTGDWLTPRVNGLPRYDKPPLVYWLMGFGYALPGREVWDPLGSWAARLPSALATLGLMLGLADTVLRWPFPGDARPRLTALIAPLAFAFSPLVLVWSRTAVSDALLCGLLGLSLLLQWRRFAAPQEVAWWPAWVILGFAVLAKGPVAVVLSGLALLMFGALRRDLVQPWQRLRPLPGLLLTALISLPWYALELLVEGQPFWDSFFGYHNLQRFTSVVNDHLQPWWFFGPVMLVAALPFTPYLLIGLARVPRSRIAPEHSLHQFAACWLLAVLLLFTTAATKLPSYWLPATPAAALLVAQATVGGLRGGLIALATDGLGNLPGLDRRPGCWVLAGIALGSLDRGSGDADAVGGFARQRFVEVGCGLVQRCSRAWSRSVASASCCCSSLAGHAGLSARISSHGSGSHRRTRRSSASAARA